MGDIDVTGVTAVVCLVGLPLVSGVTAIISHYWSKTVCHQEDVNLKHHLLAAGMSAEEIERVLNAGKSKQKGSSSEAWSGFE
ncbi:hypothetical protein [Gimesia sp.]|uniref:hypothetical protein n=1 Tax=Gimesia sp. TaxID=2024833 RepID=UPI003A8EDC95